jgi:hypothetical protein
MGIAFVYAAYLAVSIGLTVIVASALSRSGRVYLAGVFGGDEVMAAAVNRMLVVGFCLLSLGYAVLTLRTSADIHGPGQAVSVLSVKVGEELLVLGALHLLNMMFFTRLRRRQGAGGRPGAPAAGRRAADWPRASRGRTGATFSGPPEAAGKPASAAASGELGAASGQSGAIPSGQFDGTPSGQAGATDLGWPGAGGLTTAGPGQLAGAWPAPPVAREVLH